MCTSNYMMATLCSAVFSLATIYMVPACEKSTREVFSYLVVLYISILISYNQYNIYMHI